MSADNMWLFGPDLFIDRIRRSQFKELHVFAVDCEDLITAGFLMTLEKAIKERNLTKEQVKICSYKNPNVEWATFIQWNPFPLNHWITDNIKQDSCNIDNTKFSKTFLALFNRFTVYRLRLAKYIHQNFLDNAFLSFRASSQRIQSHFSAIDEQFYADEIEWCNNLPLHLDYKLTGNDYLEMQKSIQRYKDDYFVEIVVESEIHNPMVFTEKTLRGFYTGKPFILFSGPGALCNLQNWGFKTFSPFIDESYDQIENTEDRFQAICKEINRINQFSQQELLDVAKEYRSIFEHNQTVFFEHSHAWKDWTDQNYNHGLYS
jgi:hypothetical protein